MADIDLIPAEERLQRSKEKAKKAALILTLVLFGLTLIASAGLIYYISGLDKKISEDTAAIEDVKAKIQGKAAIEVSARNLDAKYKILSGIISGRTYYSVLLDELTYRSPVNVKINSVESSTPDVATLSGTSTDYVSLAKFLNSLNDQKLASQSAVATDKNLFKEVSITTVSLDPIDSTVKFNLGLKLDEGLLKR